MNLLKKILVAFIALGAASIIFLTWYSVQHAKDEGTATQPLIPEPVQKVLVAADQVNVQDSLIRKVIRGLETEHITIEVYNLSDLTAIDAQEWSAIVVFQTAARSGLPDDKVSQIKSYPNGFVVVMEGGDIFTLQGGSINTPNQLTGLNTAAIEIVDKLHLAAHAQM